MPKRKQLSEEELEEIRNLRGQMPAKQIQTKYGIGSPRLYRIWREATQKQEDVQKKEELSTSNDQLTKIENLLQNMQFDSRQLDAPVDVPDHLSDNYMLLQIHNKVEDMNKKLEHIHEILEQAQDEVESVASDVEDIDETVDSVEITTNTITSLAQSIYNATKTAEQIVYYGTIAAAIVSVLATTMKHVRWTKKESFDPQSPVINSKEPFEVKPVIDTNSRDTFDM